MKRVVIGTSTAKGFSLVELAIVVIIIGVLAVFGVPRFRDAVERAKASEAFSFLASVKLAQDRFQARQGKYATKIGELDISVSAPKFFVDDTKAPVGVATTFVDTSVGTTPGWKLTLLRQAASSSYGEYSVTFTNAGFDTANSTIASDSDLNARINPLGN